MLNQKLQLKLAQNNIMSAIAKKDSEISNLTMYKNEENVVCHMSSDRTTKQIIKSNIKNLNIIIGPEGDFSQKELNLMDSYNFKKLNLGNRRLRAESAAMCAMLKICQFLE